MLSRARLSPCFAEVEQGLFLSWGYSSVVVVQDHDLAVVMGPLAVVVVPVEAAHRPASGLVMAKAVVLHSGSTAREVLQIAQGLQGLPFHS